MGRRFASGERGFKLLDESADDFFSVELLQPPPFAEVVPAVLAFVEGHKLLLKPHFAALEVEFALPQPRGQSLPLFAKLQPLRVEVPQRLFQFLPPLLGGFPKLTMELQQRPAGLFHAVAGLLLSGGVGEGGPRLFQGHPLFQQFAAGLFEVLPEGVELGAALVESAGVSLEQIPLTAVIALDLGLALFEGEPLLIETLAGRQRFRLGLTAGLGESLFPPNERGFALVQQVAEAADVQEPEPQRFLHLLLPDALPLAVPLQFDPLPVELRPEALQVVFVKAAAAFEFDGRLLQAAVPFVAFGRQPLPLLLQLRLFPLDLIGELLPLVCALAVPLVHRLEVGGLGGGELLALGLQLPAFGGDFGDHGLLEGGAGGGEFGLLAVEFPPPLFQFGRAFLESLFLLGEPLGGLLLRPFAFLQLVCSEAELPLLVIERRELGVEVLLAAVEFGQLRAEVLDEPPRLEQGLLVVDQTGERSRGSVRRGGRGGIARVRLPCVRGGGARGGVRGAHGNPFPASTVRREGNRVPACRGSVTDAYSASPQSSAWVALR